MTAPGCPFCSLIDRGEFDGEDAFAVTFRPLKPVGPGQARAAVVIRSLRAYARIVVFAWAGSLSLEGLAGLAGLPGDPACVLGGVAGMAAACVPWRRVAWLRLRVAALRLSGGRDLVYLSADYRAPGPEAPAGPGRAWRVEDERLCRQCGDHWRDGLRAGSKELEQAIRAEKARIRDAAAAARAVQGQLAALGVECYGPRPGLRRSIILPGRDAGGR